MEESWNSLKATITFFVFHIKLPWKYMSLAFYSWRNSIKSFCVNPEASHNLHHSRHSLWNEFEKGCVLQSGHIVSAIFIHNDFISTNRVCSFPKKKKNWTQVCHFIFLFLMQNQIHSCFPLQEIKHNLRSICSFTAEKAKNVLKELNFCCWG